MPDTTPHQPSPDAQRPLVIDLDGTLVATDTLWESLMALTASQPLALMQVPGWLLGGKANFKCKVAEQVALDPAALPYRAEVLELANTARDAGRPIVLASACDRSIADAVAAHLGGFDTVVATDGKTNCAGPGKLAAIRAALRDNTQDPTHDSGAPTDRAFDYVGNAQVDLPVWAQAQTAYLVDTPPAVARKANPQGDTIELVPRQGGRLGALLRAGRPHQWVKNLLLVVPLVLGHRADEGALWLNLMIAFLALGLCASAVYLVNDLLDLRADRLHPTKCRRPLATGTLPIPFALAAAPIAVAAALLLAWLTLPPLFAGAMLFYTASAWLYSFAVKGKAMLDVIWLACLYVLRIILGGLAVEIPPTAWLLAFALFMFLSLAFAKRYAELRLMTEHGRDSAEGRHYHTDDQGLVSTMGIVSGYLAVLVLALYINSDMVTRGYERPEALWLMCPAILYWVSRLWSRAHRGLMRDDPLLFTATDPGAYLIGLFALLFFLYAT